MSCKNYGEIKKKKWKKNKIKFPKIEGHDFLCWKSPMNSQQNNGDESSIQRYIIIKSQEINSKERISWKLQEERPGQI